MYRYLMNAAAEKMFGFEKLTVIGRNIRLLMPDEALTKQHDNYVAGYLRRGAPPMDPANTRTIRPERRNGEIFTATIRMKELRDPQGGGIWASSLHCSKYQNADNQPA